MNNQIVGLSNLETLNALRHSVRDKPSRVRANNPYVVASVVVGFEMGGFRMGPFIKPCEEWALRRINTRYVVNTSQLIDVVRYCTGMVEDCRVYSQSAPLDLILSPEGARQFAVTYPLFSTCSPG